MKKNILFLPTLFFSLQIFAQSWQELNSFYLPQKASSFPVDRENAVVFTTTSQLYFGNGAMSTGFGESYPGDMYAFDVTTNLWQRNADPVFTARGQTLNFNLNGKGYICYGSNSSIFFHETWEYDPASSSWTQLSDGPYLRSFAAHFSSQGKEYFVCGLDTTWSATNLVFEFDPVANAWTQKNPFPGAMRRFAGGFSVADSGYFVCGYDTGNTPLNDVWKYDASSDTWLQKNNAPIDGRILFSVNSGTHAYCVDQTIDSLMAYDPASDTWTAKNPPPIVSISAMIFNGQNIYLIGQSECVYRYEESSDQWINLFAKTVYVNGHVVLMNNKAYCKSDVYDIASDTWSEDTNLADVTEWLFSIGDSGYTFLNGVFSRYDPVSSSWSARSPYPGVNAGYFRPGLYFSVGGKGYLGVTDSTTDFWSYDPVLDAWSQQANYPGGPRTAPGGLVIGQKGYAYSGWSDTAFYSIPDFWEYDPIANSWSQKSAPPADGRINCISSGGTTHGYVGLGHEIAGSYYDDIYEYDQTADAWQQITNPFPVYVVYKYRSGALNFVYNDQLYVGGGKTRLAGGDYVSHYEFFVYDPVINSVPEKITAQVALFPSPAQDKLFIRSDIKMVTVEILDYSGKIVMSVQVNAVSAELNIHSLVPGIYFFRSGTGKPVKFLKV